MIIKSLNESIFVGGALHASVIDETMAIVKIPVKVADKKNIFRRLYKKANPKYDIQTYRQITLAYGIHSLSFHILDAQTDEVRNSLYHFAFRILRFMCNGTSDVKIAVFKAVEEDYQTNIRPMLCNELISAELKFVSAIEKMVEKLMADV